LFYDIVTTALDGTPKDSNDGVSHSIVFSSIKVPETSGEVFYPPSNLTIIEVSLNPSPVILILVLPVRGPIFGSIE